MGFDSPTHWLIVLVVLAALFGYKKLPDMSRSVARSLRIFRTEMKGMTEDDAARKAHDSGDSPYGANPYAAAAPADPAAPSVTPAPPAPPVVIPPVAPQSREAVNVPPSND